MFEKTNPLARLALSLALVTALTGRAAADEADAAVEAATADPWAPRLNVMAGVMQWTVFHGGNLAAEYLHGRWAFEVSHGQALDLNALDGFALTQAERDSDLQLRVPWTTGFGVGYRITPRLHVLVELKAHHYEARLADGTETLRYTTFSIGPGVFYRLPLWRGLFVEPNVRWWPNVASTLDGDRGTLHRTDGSAVQHEAHDFALFANVNLGWTF
jgi:hypothetical protein